MMIAPEREDDGRKDTKRDSRGIKVRLESGLVGRVQEILGE